LVDLERRIYHLPPLIISKEFIKDFYMVLKESVASDDTSRFILNSDELEIESKDFEVFINSYWPKKFNSISITSKKYWIDSGIRLYISSSSGALEVVNQDSIWVSEVMDRFQEIILKYRLPHHLISSSFSAQILLVLFISLCIVNLLYRFLEAYNITSPIAIVFFIVFIFSIFQFRTFFPYFEYEGVYSLKIRKYVITLVTSFCIIGFFLSSARAVERIISIIL
jgi:hypothetical protein